MSGGHATYGGIHTFIAHDESKPSSVPESEHHLLGVQGYFDVGLEGADDFLKIKKFFDEPGLTLVNMEPDDELTGNIPQEVKSIHNQSTYIIYVANPDKVGRPSTQKENFEEVRSANAGADIPIAKIMLPEVPFTVKWYNPSTGEWTTPRAIDGGTTQMSAPGPGDWVLLIQKS